jgi:hypothetical protein
VTCSVYRKKFDSVKELVQYLVQKIYLSATMPLYLDPYFLDQVYLPRSTLIIRESTVRKNLCYHVLHLEKRVRKAIDVVVDLSMLVEKETWTASSRGIIFCVTRAEVDEIAASFGNTKSHSDMEPSDRLALQEKWYEGISGHRWMVATTGFIHGIDHPHVDTVIFVDMPYGLTNFVQGSGRAGRSGGPAHVFLINCGQTFISPPPTEIDTGGIIPGTKYVCNVSDCRRVIVSDVMDGKIVRCGDFHDALKCDNCDPNHPLVIASRKLLLPVREGSPDYDMGGWDDAMLASLDDSIFQSTSAPPSSSLTQPMSASNSYPPLSGPSVSLRLDQAIFLKLMKDKKAKVAELSAMTKGLGGILHGNATRYCVICWAWKNKWVPKTPSHKYFISCKTKEDGFVKHGIGWIDMKHKLQFEKFQYCWKCGLPQGDLTPVTHPTFKPGVVMDCPFDDLVVLLIWHVIHMEDIWTRACSTFNGLSKHMPLNDIVEWLKKQEQPHLFYNGLELVVWYWLTFKKDSMAN